MNYTLYIHGVPEGWSGYPFNKECNAYLKTFYQQFYITNFLRIQKYEGKWYYTYIVRGLYERTPHKPTSYFAMTLCSGEFTCNKVSSLYYVFEQTYKNVVENRIILKSSFTIGNFDKDLYNSIKSYFDKELSKYVSEAFWNKINTEDSDTNTIKQYNSYDTIDSPKFFTDTYSFTTDISPEFPTIEQRIASAKSSATDKKTINTLRQEKTNLNTQISQKDAEINSLKNEKDNLTDQNDALQKKNQSLGKRVL